MFEPSELEFKIDYEPEQLIETYIPLRMEFSHSDNISIENLKLRAIDEKFIEGDYGSK